MRSLVRMLYCVLACCALVLPVYAADDDDSGPLDISFNWKRSSETGLVAEFGIQLRDNTIALPPVTEQDIPALIAQLQQEDETASAIAFVSLTKLGDAAVKPLSTLLKSPNDNTLTDATSILALINSSKSREALKRAPLAAIIRNANSDAKKVKAHSGFLLTVIGGKEANAAAQSLLLTSEEENLRMQIIMGAILGKNTGLLPGIEQTARDPEPQMRFLSASAYAYLKGKDATPLLIALLPDREAYIRQTMLTMLGVLQDDRAIDPCITLLLFDEVPDIRVMAAIVLGSYREPRTVPYAIRGMHDDDEKVRAACVLFGCTLLTAKIGEKELVAALQEAVNDTSDQVAGMAKQTLDDYKNGKLKE